MTDLDLDLYFTLKRPSSKQLYRHLNKRWFAGRKPKTYERDARDLACGHLGLADTKDVRRNLHSAFTELEEIGYLLPRDERFRKVRPGVYRVTMDLNPSYTPGYRRGKKGQQPTTPVQADAAENLLRAWHTSWFKSTDRPIEASETTAASELLEMATEEQLLKLLPKVVRLMQEAKFNAQMFGATKSFFYTALEDNKKRALPAPPAPGPRSRSLATN